MQITIKHTFRASVFLTCFLSSEIIPAQFVGDIVNTAVAPRVAAQQPPHRQHQTLEEPVLFKRLHRISRAARIILAAGGKQRTDEFPIYPHKKQSNIFHFFFFGKNALFSKGLSISFISLDTIKACTSQLDLSAMPFLPTNTTSNPIGSFSSLSR